MDLLLDNFDGDGFYYFVTLRFAAMMRAASYSISVYGFRIFKFTKSFSLNDLTAVCIIFFVRR